MKYRLLSAAILGLAGSVIVGSSAIADSPNQQAPGQTATSADPNVPRAEIPFANHGGIYDWKADGEQAILIESISHKYYRADFMSPCFQLPYTETIGFVTDPRDVLDKFQSIVVGHQQCYFKNFTAIPKPPQFPS